jgi:hypothetical protein
MEALLTGGITLATPEAEQMGVPAAPGYHFPLVKTFEEDWLKWQPLLPPQGGSNQEKKVEKNEKEDT